MQYLYCSKTYTSRNARTIFQEDSILNRFWFILFVCGAVRLVFNAKPMHMIILFEKKIPKERKTMHVPLCNVFY
jgi:hypothetical protein